MQKMLLEDICVGTIDYEYCRNHELCTEVVKTTASSINWCHCSDDMKFKLCVCFWFDSKRDK